MLAALKIPINHRETKDIYCYNLKLTDGLSERMGLDRAEEKTENRIEWNIFREYISGEPEVIRIHELHS